MFHPYTQKQNVFLRRPRRNGHVLGHMAVGQNQWYHFGVVAPPIPVDSGDWDVHWGYGILTHGNDFCHQRLEPASQTSRRRASSLGAALLFFPGPIPSTYGVKLHGIPSHQLKWICKKTLSERKLVFLQGSVHLHVSWCEGNSFRLNLKHSKTREIARRWCCLFSPRNFRLAKPNPSEEQNQLTQFLS